MQEWLYTTRPEGRVECVVEEDDAMRTQTDRGVGRARIFNSIVVFW